MVDFKDDDIKQGGLNIDAANLLADRDDKFMKTKVQKDQYKQGEAQISKENRRGKKDLSVPVRLYIQGRNLQNLDKLSYSDPCVIVTELSQDSENNWFEIGRTEIVRNNLNPDFSKYIEANFYFEKNQKLRFEYIDDDGGDSDDPYYDLIG